MAELDYQVEGRERVSKYAAYLSEHRARHLEELKEFLRFPSISALSAHKEDMLACADWLVGSLTAVGLQQARVMPTGGHPAVYAEWLGAGPDAPTALVYGHYDVQPVDPLHLWETPPFEPGERDGKLYARGACDDKGQVFMHIKAAETLLQVDGRLPVNLKFLIEGEEEVGSRHLGQFLTEHRDLLRADVVVVSDTSLYGPGIPALTVGLRGLTALQVDLKGARGDLHSGVYGGAVQNTLHALVQLLSTLRSADGRILVEGFYDRVRPISEVEKRQWAALPFNEAAYKAELGVSALFGEPGYSAIERTWARPTLELNGIWGGFTGEGTKTVLPSEAHVKITCRLVPDQDPAEISRLVEAHLRRHLPPGVTLHVEHEKGRGRPVVISPDHPAARAAAAALEEAYGRECFFIRSGGSISVVEDFKSVLGLDTVLMGFGLEDENFHAPNEHFHLENFDTGLRALCAYWPSLAAVAQPPA